VYLIYDTTLTAHHVAKCREVTPVGLKVITANTLNFVEFFKVSLLKIVGDPVQGGV